ncbi:hypothetical protein Pdw03_3352 [Penicillium digitatum]|uniref:Uncharacterized protein n=1 Tax=Penicillium digitatum TaxID=36651 RepID=A0A7T6XG50_PENDI|nr:hypothetical protein Pdw03_3352 [Penicillium digitatum]
MLDFGNPLKSNRAEGSDGIPKSSLNSGKLSCFADRGIDQRPIVQVSSEHDSDLSIFAADFEARNAGSERATETALISDHHNVRRMKVRPSECWRATNNSVLWIDVTNSISFPAHEKKNKNRRTELPRKVKTAGLALLIAFPAARRQRNRVADNSEHKSRN